MPRRRRVPAVGTRGLGIAQLTPEVRSILKRRADRAAQREYAPQIQADKAAIGGVRQGFRNERESIMGATDMAGASLDQALRSLKSSGLSGRYLKQAAQELGARRADVASSVPFLLSDAAQERNELLTEARQSLVDTRASRDQSAASAFNSLLKSQREKASTVLKERSGGDGLSDGDRRKLRNADIALKDALTAWLSNPEYQEANPLATIDHWRGLAQQMTKQYEGIDLASVMDVIRRRLKQRQRQLRQVSQGSRDFNDVSPFTRKTTPLYQPFNAAE